MAYMLREPAERRNSSCSRPAMITLAYAAHDGSSSSLPSRTRRLGCCSALRPGGGRMRADLARAAAAVFDCRAIRLRVRLAPMAIRDPTRPGRERRSCCLVRRSVPLGYALHPPRGRPGVPGRTTPVASAGDGPPGAGLGALSAAADPHRVHAGRDPEHPPLESDRDRRAARLGFGPGRATRRRRHRPDLRPRRRRRHRALSARRRRRAAAAPLVRRRGAPGRGADHDHRLLGRRAGRVPSVPSSVLLLVPVSVWIAVTRYRLYEIDRLISRGLSWARDQRPAGLRSTSEPSSCSRPCWAT